VIDPALVEIANQHMSKPDVAVLEGAGRDGVLRGLKGKTNVGIELGVAGGSFSTRIIDSGKFAKVFGVDTYDDYYHHIDEYREAIERVGLLSNYSLLRMTFEEALELFPDQFFDFIYVDGFAHTGQEGGQTLADWFPKLKVGGIMAGDDYHSDWPLVQWAVNDFVSAVGVPLTVTELTETHSYNRYPSWFFTKTNDSDGKQYSPSTELLGYATAERNKIARFRRGKMRKRALINLKARLLGKNPR
jgi:hypothetical protein